MKCSDDMICYCGPLPERCVTRCYEIRFFLCMRAFLSCALWNFLTGLYTWVHVIDTVLRLYNGNCQSPFTCWARWNWLHLRHWPCCPTLPLLADTDVHLPTKLPPALDYISGLLKLLLFITYIIYHGLPMAVP